MLPRESDLQFGSVMQQELLAGTKTQCGDTAVQNLDAHDSAVILRPPPMVRASSRATDPLAWRPMGQ